jgi:hypothetical protein
MAIKFNKAVLLRDITPSVNTPAVNTESVNTKRSGPTTVVSMRFNAVELAKLDDLALKHGLPRSEMLRHLLEVY